MIPGNALSSETFQNRFVEFTNDPSTPLIDVEIGGTAIGDPEAGLQVQLWTARYEAPNIILSADTVDDSVLFSRAGITELSLAFDQAMRPFVAFTDAGGSAYWWYDPVEEAQVISPYLPAGSVNLRCTLDDKRILNQGNSDIILAYMRAGDLYFRQQRDRYLTEYLLKTAAGSRLVNIGMNAGNRLQFRLQP